MERSSLIVETLFSSSNRQIVSTGHHQEAESIPEAFHYENGVAWEGVDHCDQELHVVVRMNADWHICEEAARDEDNKDTVSEI